MLCAAHLCPGTDPVSCHAEESRCSFIGGPMPEKHGASQFCSSAAALESDPGAVPQPWTYDCPSQNWGPSLLCLSVTPSPGWVLTSPEALTREGLTSCGEVKVQLGAQKRFYPTHNFAKEKVS